MNLNRKAIVLAVGAALAAPGAYAQVKSKAGSEWEFYGKFYPEWTHQSGDGATVGNGVSSFSPNNASGANRVVSRWEMQVSNSYIGFRGKKDLSGGLKAIWQLETAVAIDNPDVGDPLANRNSFAGLEGSFGTVRLGNMDTPLKEAVEDVKFLSVSSGNFVSSSNIMRKIGLRAGGSFNLRPANAMNYNSPEFFGGLSYGVQYAVGNRQESETVANGGITKDRKPHLVSMALKWEKGPLYLALAHEVHFDYFGGSADSADSTVASSNAPDLEVHSKDTATALSAKYKIGAHEFGVDFNMKKYSEDPESSSTAVAGRFVEYKNTAVGATWLATWSPQWRTALFYGKASKGDCKLFNLGCSTTGLDGTMIAAGVAYYLDPSFYLFGLYGVMNNGAGARYENLESGRGNPGEDITQGAIGLAYTF
ncbi:MAG TPA: porin [Burkholderiales bacterium]|nr:porin [Burkholderiales bacterium]